KYVQTATELNNIDPIFESSRAPNNVYGMAYSRFFRYKVGTPENPPLGEVEGDAVTSWEFSADSLTLTLKLRDNMLFDRRAPTNARPLDASDVTFSWQRFGTSPSAGELMNNISPTSA